MATHVLNTTSRRHVFAALSGAAVAGGALVLAMPTEQPAIPIIRPRADAELIALCARFEDLQKQANALWSWRKGAVNVHGPNFIEDDDEREAAH